MKKLPLIIIPILAFLLYSTSGFIFFTHRESDGYSVYCETYPKVEYNLSAKEAYEICLEKNENGVSVKLKTDDYEKLVEKLLAEEKFTEQTENATLHYYTSPFLKKHVELKGEKINLQIAVKNDGEIIAGSPVIRGSI